MDGYYLGCKRNRACFFFTCFYSLLEIFQSLISFAHLNNIWSLDYAGMSFFFKLVVALVEIFYEIFLEILSYDHAISWSLRLYMGYKMYSIWSVFKMAWFFFKGVFTLLKFCRDLSIFHLVWYSRCIFLGSKSEMDGLSQKFSWPLIHRLHVSGCIKGIEFVSLSLSLLDVLFQLTFIIHCSDLVCWHEETKEFGVYSAVDGAHETSDSDKKGGE